MKDHEEQYIDSLLIAFDEMGFAPTTLCLDIEKCAIEWREKVRAEFERIEHRAEVAERALLLSCDYMSKMYALVFLATNTAIANKQELYDYYIKQAEKELSEEEKE